MLTAMLPPTEIESGHDPCWRHAALSREAGAQLTLGIVHEMNNLTGGIAVLSELYSQEGTVGMPVTEGLELIHKSTTRLQALVRHLKVVHGPLQEEPTYLDLGNFVREVLELLAPVIPKNMTVATDLPGQALAVFLDGARLRQALLAVLLNVHDAVRARPGHSSTYRLQIALRRSGDAQVGLTLTATHHDGAELADVPANSPKGPENQTRWHHAAHLMQELDGQLARGAGGEFIFELPLAR